MALYNSKCYCLMPLHFKGLTYLIVSTLMCTVVKTKLHISQHEAKHCKNHSSFNDQLKSTYSQRHNSICLDKFKRQKQQEPMMHKVQWGNSFTNVKFIACSALTLSVPHFFLTVAKMSLPNCSAPHWSNPPFLISDIRALWRSGLSARVLECQKVKNAGLDQYGPEHF